MDWIVNVLPGDLHHKVISGVAIFFVTTVVSLFLGKWWGKIKARREWNKKHFMNRLIVSLNNFSDGYLKIRTIFERSLEEVFFNSAAVDKVLYAAEQTTENNPIMPIPKEDRWFILNFILNAVAEEFTDGLVRFDCGIGLTPMKYLLFLTCEKIGPDHIRKVRAMMIREDYLANMAYGDWPMPKLEQPWHADRMTTLQVAAKLYKKEPDNFLKLEVYV